MWLLMDVLAPQNERNVNVHNPMPSCLGLRGAHKLVAAGRDGNLFLWLKGGFLRALAVRVGWYWTRACGRDAMV